VITEGYGHTVLVNIKAAEYRILTWCDSLTRIFTQRQRPGISAAGSLTLADIRAAAT
jgi:hypothetical protein